MVLFLNSFFMILCNFHLLYTTFLTMRFKFETEFFEILFIKSVILGKMLGLFNSCDCNLAG